MTTLYALTSTQALANARLDLSDATPDSDGAFRWTDADLTRAIARSLERLSQAYPNLQAIQQPAAPGVNVYAVPAGAFYVDRVEWPLGNWPRTLRQFLTRKSPQLAAPTVADLAGSYLLVDGAAPGMPSGNLTYWLTYTSPGGETTATALPGTVSSVGNLAVFVGNLPLGYPGTTGRNLYRSVNGGTPALVARLADAVTTSFIDTVAAAGIAPPLTNTTGGNDVFELVLPPELWPSDTRLMEITYAALHELDASGTTIPERHWDTLALGTVAYAMYAYLPQVNDNFQYADGHLRDRVDDTASTIAWQTQCFNAMNDFEAKLKIIREEANQGITQMAYWGDKPLKWERL